MWLSFCVALIGCASQKIEDRPYPVFVPMHGGSVMRFEQNLGVNPADVDPREIIGAMCLKPEDWEKRELYIDKLRRRH